MVAVFKIVQILSAVTLIGLILLQSTGTGISRAWGTSQSFSRRGLEILLFRATFVVAVIFVISAILPLIF